MAGQHWFWYACKTDMDGHGVLSDLFLGTGIVTGVVCVRYVRRFSGPVPLIPAGGTPTPSELLTHPTLSRRHIYFWSLRAAAISPRLALVTKLFTVSFLAHCGNRGFGDPRYSNRS